MNKHRLKVLYVHIFGVFLAWLVIHFFAAASYSSIADISFTVAYIELVALLLSWGIWQAVQIARGKDEFSLKLEQWFSSGL